MLGGDILTVLASGIPNITASIHTGANWCFVGAGYNEQGAFYTSAPSSGAHAEGGYQRYTNQVLNFDASRSNAIYGNSNTVQPPSIVLIPQIKF